MKTIKKLLGLFAKKHLTTAPVLIIRKESGDANIKEYKSIEEAIADLEYDTNVSPAKIEKLRISLNNLKNKTTIKIQNGEIIK